LDSWLINSLSVAANHSSIEPADCGWFKDKLGSGVGRFSEVAIL